MAIALSKRLTLTVAALGVALHLYEHAALAAEFSVGWLLWSLVPYAISLAVLTRSSSGIPPLCGVSVALAFDLLAH